MKWRKFARAVSKTTFVPGDWNVIDDLTGLELKASETKMRWDNAVVRADLNEPRHPQDYLRGSKDEMRTPWSRPEQADKFGQTGPDDL
jgi:hypothetical protein